MVWVDLDQGEGDAPPLVYTPSRIRVAIRPDAPTVIDEHRISAIVETRYHPQISFNTRLTFVDRHNVTHRYYVKGIQNIDHESRYLRLLCEEVVTPQ
jgi:hypothetical protein